jgi:hypothetical protein
MGQLSIARPFPQYVLGVLALSRSLNHPDCAPFDLPAAAGVIRGGDALLKLIAVGESDNAAHARRRMRKRGGG